MTSSVRFEKFNFWLLRQKGLTRLEIKNYGTFSPVGQYTEKALWSTLNRSKALYSS